MKLFRFQDEGNAVRLREIEVVRTTENGWWIERLREDGSKPNIQGELYVSKKDSQKVKYAYPTVKQALHGYTKQKTNLIDVNQKKIERAQIQIGYAANLAVKKDEHL